MNTELITLETRDLGTAEIAKESIITFPRGIYAFEEERQFVVLSPLGEGVYPMWLQSVEKKSLCFIVYNPFDIISDYNVDLDEEDREIISYEDGDELCLVVIASIPGGEFKKTTVNMKSPIVVNKTKMTAAQIILDEDYEIRYPLFNEGEDD